MSASIPQTRAAALAASPAAFGTACCVVSAICYAAANICMRRLSALQSDPIWAQCCKESVTTTVVGAVLLAQMLRGRCKLPPLRTLVLLALVGLAVEVVANVGWQWALGVIGLAVTVSAYYGVMLIASALLGRLLLGEHVSLRTVAVLALLVLSTVLLSCGAGAVSQSVVAPLARHPSVLIVALAVTAACLAGVIFAAFGATIRHCLTRAVPLGVVMFMITVTATLSLGPLSVCRLGVRPLLELPPAHYTWMLAGGLFNLVAFLAVSKGLQVMTVVRVNMLNASQVALGAVGGILLFRESPNAWLLLGVGLTLAGIFLMDK